MRCASWLSRIFLRFINPSNPWGNAEESVVALIGPLSRKSSALSAIAARRVLDKAINRI